MPTKTNDDDFLTMLAKNVRAGLKKRINASIFTSCKDFEEGLYIEINKGPFCYKQRFKNIDELMKKGKSVKDIVEISTAGFRSLVLREFFYEEVKDAE